MENHREFQYLTRKAISEGETRFLLDWENRPIALQDYAEGIRRSITIGNRGAESKLAMTVVAPSARLGPSTWTAKWILSRRRKCSWRCGISCFVFRAQFLTGSSFTSTGIYVSQSWRGLSEMFASKIRDAHVWCVCVCVSVMRLEAMVIPRYYKLHGDLCGEFLIRSRYEFQQWLDSRRSWKS